MKPGDRCTNGTDFGIVIAKFKPTKRDAFNRPMYLIQRDDKKPGTGPFQYWIGGSAWRKV